MSGEWRYTPAQNKAGNAALAALKEAERRDQPKKRTKKKGSPLPARRCVYCGEWTRSQKSPATCALHRDLPALDPHYQA